MSTARCSHKSPLFCLPNQTLLKGKAEANISHAKPWTSLSTTGQPSNSLLCALFLVPRNQCWRPRT